MQEYNKFYIYDPAEFILSRIFGEHTIETQKVISELLTKIHSKKIGFSIKIRKNKEFTITLNDDFRKNIVTVWPWEDYIQVLVLGDKDKKVNCYSKEDINEELIAKIYRKYSDIYTLQIKLDI